MSFNKTICLGRLTQDPVLSYLPSQTAVVEINLAMNRKFKKSDGSQGEEVCFVSAKIFGKRAEALNTYTKKGDPLLVEGRLCQDNWKAQDGSNRSKHYIMIENFEFVPTGQGGQDTGQDDDGGGY